MPGAIAVRLPRALLGAALVVPVLAAACGGRTEPSPSAAVIASASTPAATASTPPLATPSPSAEPTATAPVASPSASGSAGPSPSVAPSRSAAPPSPSAPAAGPEYQAPGDLALGDCFDPIEDTDDDVLLAGIVLPCAEPHRAEVFGIETLAGGTTAPYPGAVALADQAEALCDAAFETWVGIDFDDSRYEYTFYTPSPESWLAGDRGVTCAVDDGGEPITGSLKGAGR